MPLFDYHCRGCGQQFVALVPSSDTPQEEVECPSCREYQAEKKLSMKAAVIGGIHSSSETALCGASAGSGFG
ncbi:zinc ribbon domain-containing protein [Candidatus Neomarinimicrobiota bacterium]